MLDEAADDARRAAQHDEVESAKAQAAQVDSDIEAFRTRGHRRESAARTSETAHLRELLDDRSDRPT